MTTMTRYRAALTVTRRDFLDLLRTAFDVAAKTTPKDIIKSVLLEIEPDGDEANATLTATDLESAIRARCPGVRAESGSEPSRFLLPRRILDMLSAMDGDEASIEFGRDGATIECGRSRHVIAGQDSSAFPDMFAATGDMKTSWSVAGDDLSRALKFCAMASEQNSTRYAAGVILGVADGRLPGMRDLVVGATDLSRMSEHFIEAEDGDAPSAWPDPPPIIRRAAADRIARIVGDKPVTLSASHYAVLFGFDGGVFLARRVEGRPQDYRRSLPAKDDLKFEAMPSELARVVSSASASLDSLSLEAKFRVYADVFEVETRCEQGESSSHLEIPGRDDQSVEFEGGFNPRLWAEAIRAFPSDEGVTVGLSKITKNDMSFGVAVFRGLGWTHAIGGYVEKPNSNPLASN